MRNLNIVCQLTPIFLAAVFACNTAIAKPNAKPNAAARARASSPLPDTVRKALKAAAFPANALGIYVQEVDGKRALLKNQETQAFLPASTIKLVTTDAALNLLGPSYTWKTQVLGQGKQIGETWHGDVIVKGAFDPKLVQENLWLLLRQLRAKGIRQINGNIVLDRSIMPIGEQDAGKFDGDPVKAYNVVPDPLLLNFKTVRLYFRPDGKNNVQVTLDPVLPQMTIAPLRAQDGRCDDWHEQLGIEFVDKRINFTGTYPANCGEKTWDVHPYSLSPDAYFAAVLSGIWRELGGSISGTISSTISATNSAAASTESSSQPTLLVEWQSPSLAEVVRD
ncbi:MAG: D-alanyl-D-alanine carboxypeptidase, partial [Burkholderiales bacterium]|nr:D-alanyl-D-alanine carboxypeptidase [Burkholderiales bacterium]